jgi:uncharacterized protein DUF5658
LRFGRVERLWVDARGESEVAVLGSTARLRDPGTSRATARDLLHRAVVFSSRRLERPESVYLLAASLLVALNFADIALTRAALDAGASELNPIARFFVDHAVIAYTIKLGVPLAVLSLALTRRVQSRLNEIHIAAVWMIVGMYLMTVFLNVVTWLKYA